VPAPGPAHDGPAGGGLRPSRGSIMMCSSHSARPQAAVAASTPSPADSSARSRESPQAASPLVTVPQAVAAATRAPAAAAGSESESSPPASAGVPERLGRRVEARPGYYVTQ
jgi:hypothetical protein